MIAGCPLDVSVPAGIVDPLIDATGDGESDISRSIGAMRDCCVKVDRAHAENSFLVCESMLKCGKGS